MGNINPFINEFIKQGVLKTPAIIEAFKKIDRADFVPRELKGEAYINEPLPIGEWQTISQPYTVAFMIELLQPELGNKIFEIGFGSGWQTALLAHIVSQESQISPTESRVLDKVGTNLKSSPYGGSPEGRQNLGRVYAVERISELFRFGRKNIAKYNFIKKGIVKTIGGDATLGLKRHAPFDKIIAAASAEELPKKWLKELKIGGRLVAPIKNSIWLYIKKSSPAKISKENLGGQAEFEKKEFPGFVFVPLISDKN